MTGRPAEAQHLIDLAWLRRVRDRIDREYAQPLAFSCDTLGFEVRNDGAFEQLAANGAEVVQEPTDQPYGIRDFAVRDPAGNLTRINQL